MVLKQFQERNWEQPEAFVVTLQGEAAMANGCPIKELCEETTCPICLEYFKDPVILDCGHNFCRACLTQHWKGFGMAAACPQCREKDQRRSVRPNRQLANVVELVKKLQMGEKAEGKWRMCEKHQEPLKLYCEDDRAPICVVCDRSKEHRAHTVLPMEEASQEHKVSCSEAGARSLAVQYLKMDMPKLLEHCQQKGLRSEGLSVEDLRILLIQHASWPELESAKVEAKKIQCQHDAQEGRNPKEMESFRAPGEMCEEQVTAQVRWQKYEGELLQLRKKQPDKYALKSFTPFSLGGSPTAFLSNFERAAQKQKVAVEEYMIYLPPLLRGELAELYHNLPESGSVPYHVFKEAVLKSFHLGPDHFCQEFYTLQPQEGRSFLEFGARLEEALNKWLDSTKADNRDKVLAVIALDQFFLKLPPDIRSLVKAKAPQNIFQAAGMADQLMPNWEGSARKTPHLRRDGKGSPKGGWEEAHSKREKRSLFAEHKRAPNLAVSANLKDKVCYKCRETGHLKASCPKPVYLVTAFCEVGKEAISGIRETVMVKDQQVVAVVSTGSTVSIVRTDLVSPSDLVPGETFLIQFLSGRLTVPVACLPIGWRGRTIRLKVGVVESLFVSMIVGGDVLFHGPQPFEITPRQWAEWEATHTDVWGQLKSRDGAKQISSGRPETRPGTSTNSRKGENRPLGDAFEKAEPEGDWRSSSSSEEDNLAWENCGIRRQGLGLVWELAQGNWK